MARQLRVEFEGALYHVTSRGNERNSIFFSDRDRGAFLDILGKVIERYSWRCHAYCLMTNHFHLLVETPKANLSKGMHQLNGVFTQNVNRYNHRVGHLFQGRFKSILVEKETHLLELARYVVLNPVRAKMVKRPEQWKWSSYNATAGQCKVPEFLCVQWILEQFDTNPASAIEAYRRFVSEGYGVPIWDRVKPGNILGSDRFVGQIRPLFSKHSANTDFPQDQRLAMRPSLEQIFQGVTDKATRNDRIYEAIRIHEYTLKEVGSHLGLCWSTISIIAKKVAEARKHQK
jgi:putative transposase